MRIDDLGMEHDDKLDIQQWNNKQIQLYVDKKLKATGAKRKAVIKAIDAIRKGAGMPLFKEAGQVDEKSGSGFYGWTVEFQPPGKIGGRGDEYQEIEFPKGTKPSPEKAARKFADEINDEGGIAYIYKGGKLVESVN